MTDIHRLTPEETLTRLRSRASGLTPEEVTSRLPGAATGSGFKHRVAGEMLKKAARQFTHFFALMLWMAAALCFLLEHFRPGEGMRTLGYTVVAVVLINGAFSFLQEYRAEKAARALAALFPLRARIRREGEEKTVPAQEVVVGDIVILGEGDRAPADIRLIYSEGLEVSNALLTGESQPLPRGAAPSTAREVEEAENIILAGSLVLSGTGAGVVYTLGRETALGRMSALTLQVRKPDTPLHREIAGVSRRLALIAVSLGLFFFVMGTLMGRSTWDNLFFGIGILVAVVPEGLLPAVTLTLAAGSQRMARRRALVKNLEAVETLGSTTVICTDKTGTVTENRMKVDALRLKPGVPEERVYLTLAVANNILFDSPEETGGDPMERALVAAARDYFKGRPVFAEKVRVFPFTPERKRLTAVCRLPGEPELLACTKGAVETVLPLCLLNEQEKAQAWNAFEEMAAQAMRVLALAVRRGRYSYGEGDAAAWEQEMEFVGLVGLSDPVRAEVPAAVSACHTASVRIIMITGDAASTAVAVARKAGIVPPEIQPVVLTGADVAGFDKTLLEEKLSRPHIVLARMQPEHKLRVIGALQDMGHIVAMTGDGVNDAPALRKADIGVAMGERGTDVAREAADMVLLDDNFATIVNAVEEGRAVFNNIRKFITYVLTSNVAEIVPYLSYILLKIPLPLAIIQVMAIDLGTDMLPALALGMEKPRPAAMRRPPRQRKERLLNRQLLVRVFLFLGLIEAAGGMLGYSYVLYKAGWHWGAFLSGPLYLQATTACFAAIVFAQIGNVFACRSSRDTVFRLRLRDNPLISLGILTELLLLFVLMYVEPARRVFKTYPFEPHQWLVPLLMPFVVVLMDAIYKRCVGRRAL
ncbi:MAG: cation-transporting P-type ATPase [Bacillota bacterium]